MDGISRLAVILAAALALSACHRGTPDEMMTMTGRCTTRVRAKGPVAQLPPRPALRAGVGGVIGTLSDSGGALPHYTILAEMPGNAPNSPHASAIADSLGGFVFGALTPGRYRLSVRAFAHRPDSTDVEVVAGQVDTVLFSPQVFRCVR